MPEENKQGNIVHGSVRPGVKQVDVSEVMNAEMTKYVEELLFAHDRRLVYTALLNVQLADFEQLMKFNIEEAIKSYPVLMGEVMNTLSLVIGLKRNGDDDRIRELFELRGLIIAKKNAVVAEQLRKIQEADGEQH